MSYNENGDLVTEAGQVFRQVGWQVNGGRMDGALFTKTEASSKEVIDQFEITPHGSLSPLYIEVGTD